jgi:dTDP-4-dehydrorhamnose 3,5-epimerase
MKFKATKTVLEGALIVEPTVFSDDRGYFFESYNKVDFSEIGIDVDFVQDNQSKSIRGTLRGLHFQKKHPQAKLVRVLSGRVFDVAVDLRKDSPTFGQWAGVVLDDENKKQFFVPIGFAHGFLTLSEDAVFSYKCSDFYYSKDEGGVLWNDARIGIDWPLDEIEIPLLSDKDRRLPLLDDLNFSF